MGSIDLVGGGEELETSENSNTAITERPDSRFCQNAKGQYTTMEERVSKISDAIGSYGRTGRHNILLKCEFLANSFTRFRYDFLSDAQCNVTLAHRMVDSIEA